MDVNSSKELEEKGFSMELTFEPDNRPKCYYYRPSGMQVGPWPCDVKSQKHYLVKGFLLEPPKGEPFKKTFKCQVCGKEWDNLSDLIDCLKLHKEE